MSKSYNSIIDDVHSAVIRRPLRVAVTGHRQLGGSVTIGFVTQAFTMLLAVFQRAHSQGLVGLSGIATGADTIFAQSVLTHGIPLEVCLAYKDMIEDFTPGPERERFLGLQACSHSVHILSFMQRSNAAYMAVGHWLVNSCDILIAAWNGLPAAGEGGTGDVVAYAVACNKPVIHVDTLHHTIRSFHLDSIEDPKYSFDRS